MNKNSPKQKKINLRHLRAFLRVADLNSVSKAAQSLGRSQTAVTKAIKMLENNLEQKLFDRSTSGMTLTAFGEALLHRAKTVEREFELAAIAFREHYPDQANVDTNPVFALEINNSALIALVELCYVRDPKKAAENLGVSPAAVYQSVRKIEGLLGIDLFERVASGNVRPKNFAKILARHINMGFSEIDFAMDDFANLEGVTQGRLSVGTRGQFSRSVIVPRALHRFERDHPNIYISTREGPYMNLQNALRSGDLDLIVGVRFDPEDERGIMNVPLFEDNMAVIARANHPAISERAITAPELMDFHWVLPPRTSPSRRLFDLYLKRYGLAEPKFVIETSSFITVRGLLMEGDYVALSSLNQIFHEKKHGLMSILPVDFSVPKGKFDPTLKIYAMLRSGTTPSPAAQMFLSYLREAAKSVESEISDVGELSNVTLLKNHA